MRTARAALALLLAFAVPVRAETAADPLWSLLATSAPASDARAVSAEGEGPADAKGLAALQSDLLLLSDGFEGFRDEAQVQRTLARLEPRMSPELKPFFKDRASSLDAIYRTLAVADYTWAQRFPEPPCEPLLARRKLLASRDGLFQTEKGEASPWLVSLLGPQAEGKSAELALDQASSRTNLTGAEYERLRARVRKLTLALASEKAVGAARSKLYCARAAAFTDLASSHRANDAALISAGRTMTQKPEESVFVVVWKDRRAAAVLLRTKSGPMLVTDAAVVAETDHPNLFAYSASSHPVELTATVVRRHSAIGVAVLAYAEDLPRPALALADAVPAKDDLVNAVGHTSVSGVWTRTSGLVTKAGESSFQTDAAVSSEFSGGPVLNEAGEVAGLLVLRPADTEEGRWPVAVPAPVLARWLDDPSASFAAVPATEIVEDAGTSAILTRAGPSPSALTEAGLGAWNIPNLPPPPPVPHGVCVQNCGGASSSGSSYSGSYSGGGSGELGQALGELGAVLIMKGIPALFRGIGKLFRGSGKPRASSSSSSSAETQSTLAKPEPPPKPKLPLKPVGMTLTSDKGAASRGEAVRLTAEIEFTGDLGSKAGLAVTFSADPNLFEFPSGATAPTDNAGRSWVDMLVKIDSAGQAQEDLDREVRRRNGEVVAPRVPQRFLRSTQPESKVKLAAEKNIAELDAEEENQDALSPAHDTESSILKDPGRTPTEAGVNLPATTAPAAFRGTATLLGAELGGTAITASRPFNLRNPGVGTAMGVAEDEGRFNHVSIHVQKNPLKGKDSRIAEDDKTQVTVAMAQGMLKLVEAKTRWTLRNRPQDQVELDRAVKYIEGIIKTHRNYKERSSFSKDFGVKKSHRLDMEISGDYPYRTGQ